MLYEINDYVYWNNYFGIELGKIIKLLPDIYNRLEISCENGFKIIHEFAIDRKLTNDEVLIYFLSNKMKYKLGDYVYTNISGKFIVIEIKFIALYNHPDQEYWGISRDITRGIYSIFEHEIDRKLTKGEVLIYRLEE